MTGCGGEEEDNKELVLYTWEGLFPQEVLTDFEDETGIRIISSNLALTKPCLRRYSSLTEKITTL